MRQASIRGWWCRPTVLALLFAPLAAAASGRAAPTKSDSVVKVKATAARPDASGKQVVTVTLTMDAGWHTYANPSGNKDLAENETTIALAANGKPLDAKVEYPDGKLVVDAVVGNYKVYEEPATIKATVQRAKGDTGPLQVTVKIQACNDKTCLLPADVKLTVP